MRDLGLLIGPTPRGEQGFLTELCDAGGSVRTRLPPFLQQHMEHAWGPATARAERPAEPAVAPSSALAGGGTGDIPGAWHT